MVDLKKISTLKKRLDNQRPLPEYLVNGLRQDFFIRNTYHSNGIEGNTFTIYETKAVLEDGITIAGKSLREHYETTNHKEALEFIENIVNNHIPLDDGVIREIHSVLLHGINDRISGKYRDHTIIIRGMTHQPPKPFHIKDEINKLMDWYNGDAQYLHTVERAAILHSKFIDIHPFAYGDRTISRLLMNGELMKDGYPPITIEKDKRFDYYTVLDAIDKNQNLEPFIDFVKHLSEQTLTRYLSLS